MSLAVGDPVVVRYGTWVERARVERLWLEGGGFSVLLVDRGTTWPITPGERERGEGAAWAHGWNGEGPDALRAAVAMTEW